MVEARGLGPFGCWLSPLDAVPTPSIDAVRRHNDIVEHAMAAGDTPLPLRFGQCFGSLEALDAAFDEREERLSAALAAVAGCAEYGIQVLDPARERIPAASAAAPAGSGREYLRMLAVRQAAERAIDSRGRELAAEIRAQVGAAVEGERIEALQTTHGIVRLVHLVHHDAGGRYLEGLDVVRARLPELRFLVSGPWPPYSFAG